jgi:hypothetical protein
VVTQQARPSRSRGARPSWSDTAFEIRAWYWMGGSTAQLARCRCKGRLASLSIKGRPCTHRCVGCDQLPLL